MAPTLRSTVAVVLAAASVSAIVVAGLGNSQCSGVAELTEHQIIEFRRSFALLDKDGKGFVTAAQGHTEVALQAVIDRADLDGDGRMDVSEYLCLKGPGGLQEAEEEGSTGVLRILDDSNSSRGASSTGATESGHANTSGREDLTDEKGSEAVQVTDDASDSQVNDQDFVKKLFARRR